MNKIYYETKTDSREVDSFDEIKAQLESEGYVVADQWDTRGPSEKRWLVWASVEDSENDAGANAVGEIVQVEED